MFQDKLNVFLIPQHIIIIDDVDDASFDTEQSRIF